MAQIILLAAALQRWDQHSIHALAVREVAANQARSTTNQLAVLSVYDHDYRHMGGFPGETPGTYPEALMQRKLAAYVEPLKAEGLPVETLLRVGNPRELIVEVAREIQAALLVIGAHSRRGIVDAPLGGTAYQVCQHAPCTVVLVSPASQPRPNASG